MAITQDNWTAANIAISVCEDPAADTPLWIPINASDGQRSRAENISTAGDALYFLPGEMWLLSAFPYMRIESINTETSDLENQANTQSLIVVLVV